MNPHASRTDGRLLDVRSRGPDRPRARGGAARLRLGVDGGGVRLGRFSPLCWIGARTSRIKLGTGIMQISARTPACVAMTAMTIDHLSGGRLILGIGVSGPQVVEGWYGQPFPKPMARTREFITLLRTMLRREGPVTFEGEHYQLPLRGRRRARQAAQADHQAAARRTSRSTSAPRGRRTSPWRPRSPTAGCRSSTRRIAARGLRASRCAGEARLRDRLPGHGRS